MTDTPGTLEERLRERATFLHDWRQTHSNVMAEAADEIARLYSLARANNDLARRHAEEIASLRARVEAMALASREAVELIDELNKLATSRKFWGISQTVHNKLCTIRITLARQALKDTPG